MNNVEKGKIPVNRALPAVPCYSFVSMSYLSQLAFSFNSPMYKESNQMLKITYPFLMTKFLMQNTEL